MLWTNYWIIVCEHSTSKCPKTHCGALITDCKRRYILRAATVRVLECSLLLLVSVWCMWDLKTCGNDPWRSFWKVTRNLVCSSTWWKPYSMLLCLLWTVEYSKRKSRFGMVVSTTLKNHGVLPRALPASPSLSLSHSLSLSLSLSLANFLHFQDSFSLGGNMQLHTFWKICTKEDIDIRQHRFGHVHNDPSRNSDKTVSNYIYCVKPLNH